MRPQNEVRTAERVKMELKIGICVKRWPQNDGHNVWSELDLSHEPLEGIEPSAFALQVRCSATKLLQLPERHRTLNVDATFPAAETGDPLGPENVTR